MPDAFVVRLGAALASAGVVACAPAVTVQRLAAVMIESALNGAEEKGWYPGRGGVLTR